MKRLIPQLRLKQFRDKWKSFQLKKVCKVTIGRTPMARNCSSEFKYPLVRGSRDFSYHHIRPTMRTSQITKISNKGNFLLTTRTPVGYILQNNYGEVVIGRGVANLECNYFLYALLHGVYVQNIWSKFTNNLLIKSIRTSILKKLPVNIPSKAEQQKIGQFFKILDYELSLQAKKNRDLSKLRKGYFQKLFPIKDRRQPKLRFEQFISKPDWDSKQLSDLISKGGVGGTPSTGHAKNYRGQIPFLNVYDIKKSSGIINHTVHHLSQEGLNQSNAWLVKKGSLALAMDWAVGKTVKLGIDSATSQSVYSMIFKSSTLTDFMYFLFQKMKINHQWRPLSVSNTLVRLNSREIVALKFKIPSIAEQRKLNKLLKLLDRILWLNKKKLALLENLEKSYLQKMFVY